MGTPSPPPVPLLPPQGPSFAGWSLDGPVGVARRHPVLCAFAFSLLFFMGVEFTIPMVPSTSPPLDLGFIATKPLNRALATAPTLNTLLAALNTVRGLFQMVRCPHLPLVQSRGVGPFRNDVFSSMYQLVKSASSLGQSMSTSDLASPTGFKVQASHAGFKSRPVHANFISASPCRLRVPANHADFYLDQFCRLQSRPKSQHTRNKADDQANLQSRAAPPRFSRNDSV
ncbi:hypothetical protein B296_00014719 [Ensete ventricosum]|uniref:AtPDCT1/2 transmembrane domain-containing protein n=1 Tax=Ensete ventricosum TaxID=4639 RepID=A0A426YFJ1_ENSVE|nr:hypothetical protein B296_00014719 [Ensete ventricosum]